MVGVIRLSLNVFVTSIALLVVVLQIEASPPLTGGISSWLRSSGSEMSIVARN